jgi:aminoglycoside 6-adenylyltransferase
MEQDEVLLLDKDNLVAEIEPSSEKAYFIQRPTSKEFVANLNDFWWCATNVAKGIWRKELCYAK